MINKKINTIKLLLQDAKSVLKQEHHFDAEVLLANVLNKNTAYLHTWTDKVIDKNLSQIFYQLLDRLKSGEPLPYIIGSKDFYNLRLKVTKDVLIPRADTEVLVVESLKKIPTNNTNLILDLGTGSGAVALSIALEHPESLVIAVDKSLAALEVAKENAKVNNINNVLFLQSDWFSIFDTLDTYSKLLNYIKINDDKNSQLSLILENIVSSKSLYIDGEIKFDCIVSNPPYISENDEHLEHASIKYEPINALVSGEDGLVDIKNIIKISKNFLEQNRYLLLEHGYNQSDKVANILKYYSYDNVSYSKDLNNIIRVTLACLT